MNTKRFITSIVAATSVGRAVARARRQASFAGSGSYWEARYQRGGTSGEGSYGPLASFKAGVLNGFVERHGIATVLEFGCGDGNQLALANYPSYIGLDVSRAAIALCAKRFVDDATKSFYLYDTECFIDNAKLFRAETSLSLDVIYHLIEDHVYEGYMAHLFASATRFVIVYSSDFDGPAATPHMRHRAFTRWVSSNAAEWQLIEVVPNAYPHDDRTGSGSPSDFYIYERRDD